MAWQTPKTNWGQAGQTVPGATDFNRIEGNTQHLKDEIDSHKAEKATQTTLGHVKAGQNITIDSDGTINAKGGNVDSVNGKTGEVVIDVGDIPGLVDSKLALCRAASAAGNFAVAIGRSAEAAGSHSVALGMEASAGKNRAVALGQRTSAAGNYSVALGYDASTEDSYSVALGDNTSATGYSSIAVGTGATATKSSSIALGPVASATANSSIAIGYNVSANNEYEGVLGGHTVGTLKWKVPGDFTVSGTKNFEIPHPKPEKKATHVIRHGAVESPTPGDTLYRWKIQATKDNDLVAIDLPDYFIYLNKDVQIWVTGQGHFGNGYGEINRETEQLEIHCQLAGEYNVLVIGTRNDDHQSVRDWYIKGVEREIGESWTGETYAFEVDEIMEVEEIKEVL